MLFTIKKCARNLKLAIDRIKVSTPEDVIDPQVAFLAIGGYRRTDELIRQIGVKPDEIATFGDMKITEDFKEQTNGKKVLLIKKLNYTTKSFTARGYDFSKKVLDLDVADNFEERAEIYRSTKRGMRKKGSVWLKPKMVILDDPTFNLQFGNYRFKVLRDIGFVQPINASEDPKNLIREANEMEAPDEMMFVKYQVHKTSEQDIKAIMDELYRMRKRETAEGWLFKPKEFRDVVGSSVQLKALMEEKALNLSQYERNKKFGKENARWYVVPEAAFNFTGFEYEDEETEFEKETAELEAKEAELEKLYQQQLDSILSTELAFNLQRGYRINSLNQSKCTLSELLDSFEKVDSSDVEQMLKDATTKEEYRAIKANHAIYYIDGIYKDDDRKDDNYIGGKRLISIDVDEGEIDKSVIVARLESQNLFGLVYPTPKYYFDGSKRWRVILLGDREMDKESYKSTVKKASALLNIDIDESSCKLSQLMGAPINMKDVEIVNGTMMAVQKVIVQQAKGVKIFPSFSSGQVIRSDEHKRLIDFDHKQARLIKKALEQGGIPEGQRDDSYRQMFVFLQDVLDNASLSDWWDEAVELQEKISSQALIDGLTEKDVRRVSRVQ